MASPCTQGAHYAHLFAALVREHGVDVEDQHDPSHDRERADAEEDLAQPVILLHDLRLDVSHSQPAKPLLDLVQGGKSQPHVLGVLEAICHPTGVGYEHGVRLIGASDEQGLAVREGGILKKCVNSQAVYPLSEQHGLKARERRYTAHEEGKHWE